MRIIENYHHKSGVKQKSSPKIRLLLAVGVILVVVASALMIFMPNANDTAPAVLQDTADGAGEGDEIILKNYDFKDVSLPTAGQTAFKVRGGRVWSAGSDDPAPMASITKIVTALAVLEKAPLKPGQDGDTISFSRSDEQYYSDYLALQGTVTGITAGQKISQYEALQAVLLASSNNLADTLVDKYFGSQEEFIGYANSMLLRLGLEQTVVADASGFNPSSTSTPSDLLKLGEYALAEPVIAEIVAQEDAEIMDGVPIPNYNALIGFDEITGIKPGFTDEAGYCLLFSADFVNKDGETEQFIAVVMGIQDRGEYFEALSSLYEGGKKSLGSQSNTEI